LVMETNTELAAFQQQLEEIVVKKTNQNGRR